MHGAFRGGWAWDRVRPSLEAAGHLIETPTLSSDQHVPASLSLWTDELLAVLESSQDLTLLVGHSQGGIVALAAAAAAPLTVGHLVLLDSPVPLAGQSAADVLPLEIRRAYGDPPREAWIDPTPTGDPGVDARLVSAPVAPAYDVVDPDGVAAALPTTYVFCSRTPDGVPAAYSRQRFDREQLNYRLLDADHDAPLRQPELVSQLILDLAGQHLPFST